jgi:hypothetical protein
VEVGAVQAADHVGADAGRLASAWPALAVALVAGIWSIRLSNEMWRRSAACLCLMPVLLVFEIVGWSHGWIVGTVVMLAGYVVAALASGHVPSLWSPAVGVSALVLALSSVAGLLPAMVRLAARLERPFGPLTGDVAPWLLPLTTSAVLALLPQVTIGSRRLRVDWRNAAGAFVATLGVLPLLWGASFWVSFTVLVMVAVLLLVIAGQWRSDVVLVLGLSLLAIMGIFARHGDLADPLAWTIIALACLAWATIEPRLTVWLGFLTTSGLFALLAVAQWLTFAQVPRSFHGLVVVVVGSIGLLGSQWFLASPGLPQRATARLVGERLCVVWMVVGLAMAESSPSHHALELTVAGVAAGITSQVSPDRRPAGWASGVLLTIASWVRLADSDIQVVEWYTLPAATALLVYGTRRLRADTSESSLRCLGPGLTLALVPSLLLALDEPVSWRGLAVGLASVALVALGSHARLAAPFALGVTGTALLALRNIWPVAAFVPRWTLLFLIGGVLLATGMTWESRVRDARTASRYVRGLH